MRILALICLFALAPLTLAANPALEVKLPAGARIKSGQATARDLKLDIKGTASGNIIRFDNLLPGTRYDVLINLEDGTILRGVDMGWYAPDKAARKAEPLEDDDKAAIRELFDGIKAFENKRNMLLMSGDHDRVTILAELVRDNGFHSDAGQEAIWRIEIWYFKNQHGGWEKIQQQNEVLIRERFKTKKEYEAARSAQRYIPELGGLKFAKDEPLRSIEIDPAKKSPMADVPAPAGK